MQARILVVDDEKFIVEAISQHLTHLGHEVLSFLDPAEALLAIKSEQVDLVLTDLRMPDVSGMDITRAVHDKGEDTRVVILTGYATLDSAIESVHLQVYAYLNKPFDLRETRLRTLYQPGGPAPGHDENGRHAGREDRSIEVHRDPSTSFGRMISRRGHDSSEARRFSSRTSMRAGTS